MKIYLWGIMGSGKNTQDIAKLLAQLHIQRRPQNAKAHFTVSTEQNALIGLL